MTYNRVLVLIRDEATAVEDAEFGIALAEQLDAAVHHLRVVETQSSRLSLGSDSPAVTTEQAVPPEVKELVAETAVDSETHTIEGPIPEQVQRYATEQAIDLIVIGSQTNDGAFDSLVDSVVQAGDIPVLAVPDGARQFQCGQLVVPNLAGVPSEAATEHAVEVAGTHGMTVNVVTVIDLQRAAGPFNAGGVTEEFIEHKERELRSAVEDAVDLDSELTFETRTASGRPAEVVSEYVADAGVDALVVGHDGAPPLVGRLRTTGAGRIRRTIDVPALVVP
ncbi:universal stress protein [Haloarcula sp. S1AR25-5A]|uniref:Universal stress protein n=1 Tax=Haloarcula terrestris TaxID=2950533 RepID=A0AAE4EUW2_9EURY|nr:universal stress protein [Haloarcula terrestris]MDS0220571.1 universal stress protein [Haloarcula terrestris]